MVQFSQAYPHLFSNGAQLVPQIRDEQPPAVSPDLNAFALLSWGHNIILIQKLKDLPTRLWYACQTLAQGRTRDTLILQIKNHAHARQGAAITNVTTTLPSIETIEAELSVDLATEDAS
jgi:hypothetical protein